MKYKEIGISDNSYLPLFCYFQYILFLTSAVVKSKSNNMHIFVYHLHPIIDFSVQIDTVYRENFAPVLFSPFSPSDLGANLKLGYLNIYKGICKKIGEWVNSRLGESVSDLHRAKIRLGEFKAVYSRFFHALIHCLILRQTRAYNLLWRWWKLLALFIASFVSVVITASFICVYFISKGDWVNIL